jgi:hypothetical protein
MGIRIEIEVAEELFEFTSFVQWVNKAASWFASHNISNHNYVCVDAKGRACRNGFDFQRADREGAFPVKVYSLSAT